MDKQWAVVWNGSLVRTFGREHGSRDSARNYALEYGWGAVALLLAQKDIDVLK